MYRLKGCRELRNRAPQMATNWFNTFSFSRSTHSLPFVTNITAEDISGSQPAEVHNLVQGKWTRSSNWSTILDPLNGESFIKVAEVDEKGMQVTTEAMLEHKNKLLQIPGSKLLFGGEELENHSIPAIYGAIKPTAVFVPLDEILKDDNYELVTKEIFGPFQIVTEYKDNQLRMLLNALERMHAHLTAAVVSNDVLFLQDVIGKSVNGTTYV